MLGYLCRGPGCNSGPTVPGTRPTQTRRVYLKSQNKYAKISGRKQRNKSPLLSTKHGGELGTDPISRAVPRHRKDQSFRWTLVQITSCKVSYSSPFPCGKAHREMEKEAEQRASLVGQHQGAAPSQARAHFAAP